jgi:hypothetical protein
MPIAYNPTSKDGRSVAETNDLRVLKAVRIFGHLRRQELAMAVWPKSSPKSASIMAWRTTARLLKAEMLLERDNILGGKSLILGAKGVARLKDANLEAQEGYELAFNGPQFFHRTLGTSYLLHKAKDGSAVFGEYALLKKSSRNWSPLDKDYLRSMFNKIPDGLIMYSGKPFGLKDGISPADWVEVESAYKPYEELKKALDLTNGATQSLNKSGSVVLNKVVFVYDARQGHEKYILRAISQFLKEELPKHPRLTREGVLSEIVLAKCLIEPPLVWHGVIEQSALDLMNGTSLADLQEDLDTE